MNIVKNWEEIEAAKKAAEAVLIYNSKGPFDELPRTAAWGYPEPYTRDLMFAVFGISVSANDKLVAVMKRTLEVLANNQSERGHIPSIVHDPENRGASDTTPLFLLAVGIFRKMSKQPLFLETAVQKSLTWMAYQSPSDNYLVAQQPTSDWRDEQWVLGFGLYVNMVFYSALRMLGYHNYAEQLGQAMHHFTIKTQRIPIHRQEGLLIRQKPYYAFWSYKIYSSERFDLLGNALAILSGYAPQTRALEISSWIEQECRQLQENGYLGVPLAPNFFPFIFPEDPDWLSRYKIYNEPGNYHNGGIWPFISGIHISALVAAGRFRLAREKLDELTILVKKSRDPALSYGFNEWYQASGGQPMGQDWQTWSAALYLYAAYCVQHEQTPFFER